ncbi:7209_t:CDS:2 [Entrophospora sp. SA101]|nr:1538_t:CDS:2 [Entrophospora sp. SA101]CAJ0835212.1 7209_t:CDS:2 [Entrophospora sp. SA101]
MQENQKFIPRLLTDLKKLYHGGNTKDAKIVFKKPNIKPKIFDALFSYIYIGEVDLTDYDGFMLIELLEAADELLMNDELVLHVQKYLRDTKTDWIQENLFNRLLPESVDTRFFQKSTTGPMFGNHDLYISDECNSNYLSMHKRENYARRIREHGHFLVEDYEVFKVTKKI